MCQHGTLTEVYVRDKGRAIPVDSCIAEEIRELNEAGVITLGSCCGHGRAGQVETYTNGFGEWREFIRPPHVLIKEGSVHLLRSLGYAPFPYFYADGESWGVWQAQLKTGDILLEEAA